MKKILLSTIAILVLTVLSANANGIDDIMQSRSSKQSTDHSQATSRNSPSSKHNQASVNQAQLEEFASVNSDQLAKEIAAGQGEMVNTLATLLNVENKVLFISKLQNNYQNIYTSSDMKSSDVLKNISKI
ncbi:MAG: DUF3015 family protein [Arcobacteraceae bacterium]